MATKDELRLSMGKVADWNGEPGLLKFTMGGEPQSLMVTPANMNAQMQVGQLCATCVSKLYTVFAALPA